MNDEELTSFISSWRNINTKLNTLSEKELSRAIMLEITGRRNKDVAVRLHQRLCNLRMTRERAELITNLTDDLPEFMA